MAQDVFKNKAASAKLRRTTGLNAEAKVDTIEWKNPTKKTQPSYYAKAKATVNGEHFYVSNIYGNETERSAENAGIALLHEIEEFENLDFEDTNATWRFLMGQLEARDDFEEIGAYRELGPDEKNELAKEAITTSKDKHEALAKIHATDLRNLFGLACELWGDDI